MKQIDLIYRAFCDYRKHTKENVGCKKERDELKKFHGDKDKLETQRLDVKINTDWVDKIEEGLVFVGNAIFEERQFIRTNGEVVPIEKAKGVSKDSVKYLAKHSNMITRLPENEDDTLVPDEIYIVEKLSDYAVYENRFLYMMLSYLNDFIMLRLGKIDKAVNSYKGKLIMQKSIKNKSRVYLFETTFVEERTDDKSDILDKKTKAIIKRINDALKTVTYLLSTPLMQQVSKSPMIKPPVVKTNVLKMNKNFVAALDLYEYISTYQGLGLSIDEVINIIDPFNLDVADELNELIVLTSFLTYMHGNEIKPKLQIVYEEGERQRKEEESKKLLDQIVALKRRISDLGETPENYMVILEQRNRELEKQCAEISAYETKILELKKEIEQHLKDKADQENEITKLNEENADLQQSIIDSNEAHINELVTKEMEYQTAIEKLKTTHDEEVAGINENWIQKQASITEEFEEKEKYLNSKIMDAKVEMQELSSQYEDKIRACLGEKQAEIDKQGEITLEYTKTIKDLTAEYEEKLALKQEEYNVLLGDKRLVSAQLHALREEHHLFTSEDDFTSKERFVELEHEYKQFQNLFKRTWKETKKKIRKELLGSKPVPTKKEEDLEEAEQESLPDNDKEA